MLQWVYNLYWVNEKKTKQQKQTHSKTTPNQLNDISWLKWFEKDWIGGSVKDTDPNGNKTKT